MVVGICALAALVCATLPGAAQALCMAWPMPPAYHQASRALRDGRVTDAVRLFRQAARYPGEEKRWVASAYAQAGGTALREQRYVEAAGHFRAAMSEVPSFYGVATGLLRSLEGAGRYHEALQAARQFPEGERDSPGTLRLRARLHACVCMLA